MLSKSIRRLIQRGMSLNCGLGSIISHMVIDMDETRLQTISQLQPSWARLQRCVFVSPTQMTPAMPTSLRWPSALASVPKTPSFPPGRFLQRKVDEYAALKAEIESLKQERESAQVMKS